MSRASIPLGDAWLLRRFTRRTQLVRLVLAAAILATALAAVLVARTSSNRAAPVLPAGSDGVVVLDVSASASATEYGGIHKMLMQVVHSQGRFGLVVFSDRAYEALPPNTPADEFATVARYFQGPVYPTNPWTIGFSLGTSISQGLDLARDVILADGVRRRNVWLISDLGDAHADRPLLSRSLRQYIGSGIALHVLGVDPTASDLAVYRRFFGAAAPGVEVSPLPAVPAPSSSYAFPIGLAIAAIVLALALALNELFSTPLRWSSRATPQAAA